MQILNYHHRVLELQIVRTLKAFPVLGPTGPRQSGVIDDKTEAINYEDYLT